MPTKWCAKGQHWCANDRFANNACKKDGLQDWCRDCKKAEDAKYYQRNKDKYLEYNRRQYARLNALLTKAKDKPCADCGGRFPAYVMDFDHLDGAEKLFDVGRARKHSWRIIEAEIAKCELVCANCHRIRTHERSHMSPLGLVVKGPLPQSGNGRVGSGTGYAIAALAA